MKIESSMKAIVTDIVYDTESDGVIYDATELKLPTELEIELWVTMILRVRLLMLSVIKLDGVWRVLTTRLLKKTC